MFSWGGGIEQKVLAQKREASEEPVTVDLAVQEPR